MLVGSEITYLKYLSLNLSSFNIAFDQTWVPFIVILSEKIARPLRVNVAEKSSLFLFELSPYRASLFHGPI